MRRGGKIGHPRRGEAHRRTINVGKTVGSLRSTDRRRLGHTRNIQARSRHVTQSFTSEHWFSKLGQFRYISNEFSRRKEAPRYIAITVLLEEGERGGEHWPHPGTADINLVRCMKIDTSAQVCWRQIKI